MRRAILWAVLVFGLSTLTVQAQSPAKPFPAGVFTARTVAIVNDSRQPAVEKGADEALTHWGQLKVVDDPQLADIVIHFDRTSHREGRDTQKKNDKDNSTSYGYEFSTTSTVFMTAFYKDSDTPFYSTKTEDSKAKAGTSCIDALRTAWRTAAAPHQP